MKFIKHQLNKNRFIAIALIIMVGAMFFSSRPTLAREPSGWLDVAQNNGLGQIGNTAFGTNKPQDIRTITANLTNVFLGLLGTIFIILMIAGGFIWMNSAGNADKAETAKKLMGAGVIGLLIVLGAFAISLYITSRAIYSVNQGFIGPGEPEWPDPNIKTNDYTGKLF